MKKILLMSLLLSFSFANANDLDEINDVAKGKLLSANCSACHGVEGVSSSSEWPNLAGLNAAYLIKQLKDYRSGKRKDAVMTAMAKSIESDDDINNISAYYSDMSIPLNEAKNRDLVLLGESIYRGGIVESGVAACSACHGPTGSGNPMAKFPRVAGQHAEYIVTQLQAFKSGERNNDSGKMMRNIAEKMTEMQMQAVAEYMSALGE